MNTHQLLHWLIIRFQFLFLLHSMLVLELLQSFFKHFICNLRLLHYYVLYLCLKFNPITLKLLTRFIIIQFSLILFNLLLWLLWLITLLLCIARHQFNKKIIFKFLIGLLLSLEIQGLMNLFQLPFNLFRSQIVV